MTVSVAIVGQGFVGGSLTTVLSEKDAYVNVYDKAGKCAEGFSYCASSLENLVKMSECDPNFSGIYFICLPTPMRKDGSADLSIVEGVLAELSLFPGDRIAVVKSTIPPGTTEKWNREISGTGLEIVFCPEFLVEATALQDMRNQDRIILGGSSTATKIVAKMFNEIFPGIPVFETESANAELTKYFANCFLAMKVSFANEMYQLCEGLKANNVNVCYNDVVALAILDSRLGKSHWKVPSFEVDDNGNPLFGYSLSCFPKDINALIHLEKSVGVDPKVLEGGWKKNLEVRPGMDWLQMKGRAVSE